MDPNEALTLLHDGLNHGDMDQVEEYADYILDWLDRGGFPPVGNIIFLSCDAKEELIEKIERLNERILLPC